DALNNVVDLLFGGAVRHVDDHGDYLSVLPPKNESRDFYRGFGGIFELSLLLCGLAPILHLRREWKPIAAKKTEVAKSCHRDSKTRIPEVFQNLWNRGYCIELATVENALLALPPIRRTVPITNTRMTASMTAYSAMSCPFSSWQTLRKNSTIDPPGLLGINFPADLCS